MSDFNPYSHWLGFTGKEKPETYYELLGLPHGEKNVQKIAAAVEEMTAKVQKTGPDGHFPEWNQMLTEIQVAKNCLCNPKYKADYDAKHPAPSSAQTGAAPQPAAPQGDSQAQAQAQPQPGAYPGMYPQPGMQQGMYMQPGMYVQPGMYPVQPGAYPGMQPGMYVQPGAYPVQPGMQPGMYPGMYQQPGMIPQPVQPQMVQPIPQGVVQPQPAVAPAVAPTVAPTAAPVVAQVQPQAQAPAQPANPLGGGKIFGGSSSPASGSASPVPSFSSKPSGKSSGKSSVKSRKSSSGPTAMQRNIIAVVGLLIVAVLAMMLMNKRKPIEVAIDENGEVSVNLNNPLAQETPAPATSPSETPAPVKETPEEEPVPSEPKEEAANAAVESPDFAAIMQAIRNQEYKEADQLLSKARKMNLSEEDSEHVKRLEIVLKYAGIFYNEMMKCFKALQGQIPAELCEGKYGLVEASKEKIIIKTEHGNVKFTKDRPAHKGYNLYDIFYQHQFAKQVESGNMEPVFSYAVFEFLSPECDRDKAVKLLETVNEKGEDKDRETAQAILAEFSATPEAETAQAEENVQEVAQLEEEKAAPEETETSPKDADEEAQTTEKPSKKKDKKVAKDDDAESKAKEAEEAEKKAKEEALAKERHENEWKQLTTSLRQDLGWQRMAKAKQTMSDLEKIAQSDEEKAEQKRLKLITDYMELFVKGVGNRMGDFGPGTAHKVNGKEIAIVDSAPNKLKIRDEGQNFTYTPDNLNPRLVEFLMSDHLKEADDYLLYGTYLAMDPEGNREKAKSYWNTAVSKDPRKKDDVDILKAELDVPLIDAGKRPNQMPVIGKGGKQIEQRTIPIGSDRDKALEDLKKEFASDYAKDDPQSKRKLAEKFVKQAQQPKTPSAIAYVMAEEATRLAKEANYYEIACQGYMIHEMYYGRDTYQERLDFMKKADPMARGNASEVDYVNCVLAMGFDCVTRGKKIDANQMLNLARGHVKGAQVKKMKTLEMTINQMK